MAVAWTPSAGVGWPEGGPTVAAALIYDTAHAALPAGVRAVTRKDERQLLFSAGELELLVQVPALGVSELVDVAGQLLADGLPVTEARISLETERGCSVGITERHGAFNLRAASAGTCRVAVTIGARVIQAPPFVLS